MPAPHSSRENGKLGGRPKGSSDLERAIYNARRSVARRKLSLAERCQENEERLVAVCESIAFDETQPATARIGAVSLILDRGRGKPVTTVEGTMNGTVLHVITGVPRAEPTVPTDARRLAIEHDK
jgi:hypothetical protein